MRFFKNNKNKSEQKNVVIEDVKKIGNGVYLINKNIKICNIELLENGKFTADVQFDELQNDEEQVTAIVKKFVSKAIIDDVLEE